MLSEDFQILRKQPEIQVSVAPLRTTVKSHEATVSTPFALNPDPYVFGEFTLSPLDWLRCQLVKPCPSNPLCSHISKLSLLLIINLMYFYPHCLDHRLGIHPYLRHKW